MKGEKRSHIKDAYPWELLDWKWLLTHHSTSVPTPWDNGNHASNQAWAGQSNTTKQTEHLDVMSAKSIIQNKITFIFSVILDN